VNWVEFEALSSYQMTWLQYLMCGVLAVLTNHGIGIAVFNIVINRLGRDCSQLRFSTASSVDRAGGA
jgi:hypothetical protein